MWLVKISGGVLFWVFMMLVVAAIVIMTRRDEDMVVMLNGDLNLVAAIRENGRWSQRRSFDEIVLINYRRLREPLKHLEDHATWRDYGRAEKEKRAERNPPHARSAPLPLDKRSQRRRREASPLIIRYVTPAPETTCQAVCKAWDIIEELYYRVNRGYLRLTGKETEDLKRKLNLLKGHLDGVIAARHELVKEVKPLEDVVELLVDSFEMERFPERRSVRSPPCGTS
jgi:hypothetical protein